MTYIGETGTVELKFTLLEHYDSESNATWVQNIFHTMLRGIVN